MILILFMSGCHFKEQSEYLPKTTESGQEIFNNGGIAAQRGDFIFFTSDDGIYVSENNTPAFKLMDAILPKFIYLSNEHIYFLETIKGANTATANAGGKQTRIVMTDLNGNNKQTIAEGDIRYFNFDNQRIVYTEIVREDEYYTQINKISLNDYAKKTIIKKTGGENYRWYYCDVYDDELYYVNIGNDGALWRVNLDGTNDTFISDKTQYTDSENPSFCVSDGWIYYTASTNNVLKLYKMRLDGTDATMLLDKSIGSFTVADGYIYYTGNGVYRMTTDGTNEQKLFDTELFNISVLKDSVFGTWYSSDLADMKIYKVKNDGSMESRIMWESKQDEQYGIH